MNPKDIITIYPTVAKEIVSGVKKPMHVNNPGPHLIVDIFITTHRYKKFLSKYLKPETIPEFRLKRYKFKNVPCSFQTSVFSFLFSIN